MAVRLIDAEKVLKHFRFWIETNQVKADERKAIETCIKVIENTPTLPPPNEFLTVDDLLEMNQTPIWVMDTTVNRGEWCYWKDGRAYSCESHPEYYDLEDYGKWTAYHQPPRGCRYGRNML